MTRKIYTIIIAAVMLFAFTPQGSAEQLTPELCKQKAKAAAALVKAEGEAAFDKLKDPKGEFIFGDGEGYVWVHNLEGKMVMHPIKPSLNGSNLLDMRDVNGVYLFAAMNDLVQDKGEGWVPYAWPKPGQKESSPKVSYVILVKHGDKNYVVGSGMYDVTASDIAKKFPGDAIYQDK
ncbi:MAG: cache domain-containing protein [Desulfocapsaceae bacterium]|nr:cache domain-containing protein [Desulfocapsaceae bacterium]